MGGFRYGIVTRTLFVTLTLALTLGVARAATLEFGINVPNIDKVDAAKRQALVGELQAAGVHEVRFGLAANAQDMAFAKQLYEHGIKINLIVDPVWAPGAPFRAFNHAFPHMYASHFLSNADPGLSKAYFQSLISGLDANGVKLASLELGNEINWSAFNGEFPLPGEGKIFSLQDLQSDPEGQRVARGYLQYLKILAVLKDVRDSSTVNRDTPIISAGLSNTGRPRSSPGAKEDGASIDATIEFLRAHGLDNLVDGYGIHYYPENSTAKMRLTNLENNAVTECRAAGSGGGKPCWITEWGVTNPDVSCPTNDAQRTPIVNELKGDFEDLAAQGRVVNIIYYTWTTWAKKDDPYSVFRCGMLSEAGRAALGQ